MKKNVFLNFQNKNAKNVLVVTSQMWRFLFFNCYIQHNLTPTVYDGIDQ